MSHWLLITLVALGVIVLATGALLLLNPGKAGDPSKVQRTFNAQEQEILDSRTVTLAELTTHDGRAGQSAWIAVNGVAYDVTGRWKEGGHHGLQAGRDLTGEFVASGHAGSVLGKLPVVGRLVDG